MNQEYKLSKGKNVLKILSAIALFLVLCFLCACAGYYFVRARNPLNNPTQEEKLGKHLLPEESHAPFHLPTLQIEEEIPFSSSVPLAKQTEYLVIAENDAVRLYRLTQSGEKTFLKNLDISLSSLAEEDRRTLKEGRILKSEDELSSLLEDYTS